MRRFQKYLIEHYIRAHITRMETELFRQFLQVARSGSFAAAAHALDKDPSSLSRAIAALESELGVRLFHRTTRKLALTEAGETFLHRIDPVTAEIEAIGEELRQSDKALAGRVSLSTSVAFGQKQVMPHVAAFRERYPDLLLDLKLTDRNVDLVAEQIDFAIRLAPSLQIDVVASKLITTRYHVVASPQYIRESGPLQSPQELSSHPVICFDLPVFKDRWRFKDGHGAFAVEITPVVTITSALALREAALMGLGPALLADWMIRDDLASGDLIDLFPDYLATATDFDAGAWMIYPKRTFIPARTRATMDFFRDAIRLSHGA